MARAVRNVAYLLRVSGCTCKGTDRQKGMKKEYGGPSSSQSHSKNILKI